MGAVVADTSVLIGYFQPGDTHHRNAREALEEAGDSLCVSVISFSEVMTGVLRAGKQQIEIAERFFNALPGGVEPVSRSIGKRAAELRVATPRLRLPDALVVATGDVLDADLILTADRRWRGVSNRVRII